MSINQCLNISFCHHVSMGFTIHPPIISLCLQCWWPILDTGAILTPYSLRMSCWEKKYTKQGERPQWRNCWKYILVEHREKWEGLSNALRCLVVAIIVWSVKGWRCGAKAEISSESVINGLKGIFWIFWSGVVWSTYPKTVYYRWRLAGSQSGEPTGVPAGKLSYVLL